MMSASVHMHSKEGKWIESFGSVFAKTICLNNCKDNIQNP